MKHILYLFYVEVQAILNGTVLTVEFFNGHASISPSIPG